MKYSIIKKSDCVTSEWRGGKTTEIAIFPENKKYIDRDFIWRLSSATVELEESDFTKLPDYDRVLLPLEGEVILSFNDKKTVRLRKFEQASFSGEWRTKSFGKITDFNLMTRKGVSRGEVDIISLSEEAADFRACEIRNSEDGEKITHAVFCAEGYMIFHIEGKSSMLSAGDTLLMEFEQGENPEYSLMGEGAAVRAEIRFSYKPEDAEPVFIPRERASFDDFKCAFFLANTQFRFADRIFKRIKNTWYDEELSGAIKKLERFYLTFLLSIAGLMCILLSLYEKGMGDLTLLMIIIGWFIFDIAVISPTVYLIFLPKPIRKHIKDIDKLTAYERTVRAREIKGNERLDKLMKKYRNSGKNIGYDKEGKDDLL